MAQAACSAIEHQQAVACSSISTCTIGNATIYMLVGPLLGGYYFPPL